MPFPEPTSTVYSPGTEAWCQLKGPAGLIRAAEAAEGTAMLRGATLVHFRHPLILLEDNVPHREHPIVFYSANPNNLKWPPCFTSQSVQVVSTSGWTATVPLSSCESLVALETRYHHEQYYLLPHKGGMVVEGAGHWSCLSCVLSSADSGPLEPGPYDTNVPLVMSDGVECVMQMRIKTIEGRGEMSERIRHLPLREGLLRMLECFHRRGQGEIRVERPKGVSTWAMLAQLPAAREILEQTGAPDLRTASAFLRGSLDPKSN